MSERPKAREVWRHERNPIVRIVMTPAHDIAGHRIPARFIAEERGNDDELGNESWHRVNMNETTSYLADERLKQLEAEQE